MWKNKKELKQSYLNLIPLDQRSLTSLHKQEYHEDNHSQKQKCEHKEKNIANDRPHSMKGYRIPNKYEADYCKRKAVQKILNSSIHNMKWYLFPNNIWADLKKRYLTNPISKSLESIEILGFLREKDLASKP